MLVWHVLGQMVVVKLHEFNMKLIENVDYYIDERSGLMILTSHYLEKRGYCCGNKCKNCPYDPSHMKGNTKIKKPG